MLWACVLTLARESLFPSMTLNVGFLRRCTHDSLLRLFVSLSLALQGPELLLMFAHGFYAVSRTDGRPRSRLPSRAHAVFTTLILDLDGANAIKSIITHLSISWVMVPPDDTTSTYKTLTTSGCSGKTRRGLRWPSHRGSLVRTKLLHNGILWHRL